jgi:exopolysaccharide production protein ExoY
MRDDAEWGKWKVFLPSTIHLNGPAIADPSHEVATGNSYQIAVGQSFLNPGAARNVQSFGVDVFPLPVDSIRRPSQPPIGKTLKRAVDILISAIALIAAAPLFLAIALLIKITTGGPVFYSHPRVGFQGRKFGCLKFRTMIETSETALLALFANDPVSLSEWRVTRKLRRDPRITPLGHILRKLSLDELPQFINVLRGDMSCVGPRPIVEEELEKYGMSAVSYKSTRPGLTGLWQVSGRSRTSYKRRVALDRYYTTHWSLMLDAAILLRTIPAVLRYEDAV